MAVMDDFLWSVDSASLRLQMFILDLLGWIALTALLITTHFSERVQRHAVFINFLCTWVMYSSYKVFACVLFLNLCPEIDVD